MTRMSRHSDQKPLDVIAPKNPRFKDWRRSALIRVLSPSQSPCAASRNEWLPSVHWSQNLTKAFLPAFGLTFPRNLRWFKKLSGGKVSCNVISSWIWLRKLVRKTKTYWRHDPDDLMR